MLRVILTTVVILAAAVQPVFADCVFTVRPATAEEKKIYADGFALFQRMAPPAPAGWQHSDNPKNNELKEVCAASAKSVTRWGFQRSFERVEGMQERQAKAVDQVKAVAEQSKAAMKTNEAKLEENQRQMNAAMKKMQELAAAQKIAEMEAVNKDVERLMKERESLMGLGGQDAKMQAVDAEVRKDTGASFNVVIGETDVDTSGFTPMAVPVGKGYRQDLDNSGNPWLDIVVVLPTPSPGAGQTVVRISGDPARAEALFKAAKLR